MLDRLEALLRDRCAGWGGKLVEINGEADDVHLLIQLPPSVAPAGFVNNLKTLTSRLLRKEFKEQLARFYSKPVLWSWSFFIISCGGASLEAIQRYIQDQARSEGES